MPHETDNRTHAPSADSIDDHDVDRRAADSERKLVSAAWAQFEHISSNTVPSGSSGQPQASHRGPGFNSHAPSFCVPGYRILGEIHRGGQGVVYQAIQESTLRKKAIKVLKEGPFADPSELSRFEREVDVLSRLDHPHIVGIHDHGSSAGHAYYVMDYIAGQPLDAYVASADLSLDEILNLFVQICDAVNVAHLRGVIHRDLKPGNIRIDVGGQPRILDFGLAKWVQDAADRSSAHGMTLTGQFVGSLPWASPEQAGGPSDLIDIRTDVYSLGVILYQMVTGRFPYPVSGRIDDVVRHIVHTSPARPSALRRDLDRDVEIIILKCLSKEAEHRYQSAGDLVRDLRHFLAKEPILATPPSAGYRLRRFVQRNRGLVAAGVAIAFTLVAASAVSIAFGLREARQRERAESALRRTEAAEREALTRANQLSQVSHFQAAQLSGIDARTMGLRLRSDLLKMARVAAERLNLSRDEVDARVDALEKLIAGSDFTGLALESLEQNFFRPALEAIDKEFANQPLVKAQLLQTLASTLQELGLYEAASGPQDEALAIRSRELGEDHLDTLTSIICMGYLLRAQGKIDQAEPYYREALEKSRRILGEEHPDTLTTMNNMGFLLQDQGKLDQAEPYYREVLEKRRRVQGDEHPDTLAALNNMGYLLQAQGNLHEAEPYWREALEKNRRVLGDEHPNTLRSINNMGYLLQAQGKLADAEPFWREALENYRHLMGDEHPETLRSIYNMGYLLQAQGKLAEAEPYYREALEKRRRVLGDEHPDTLISISNMGFLLQAQGNLDEAEPYYREALEKRRRVLGDEHPHTLASISSMGDLLRAQGEPAQAIEILLPAERAARQAWSGDNVVRLGRFLTALGRAGTGIAEFEKAEANLIEAHAILSEAKGATAKDRTDGLTGLVELYDAWHAAEPGKGYDTKAADWRAKHEKWQASTQPTPHE